MKRLVVFKFVLSLAALVSGVILLLAGDESAKTAGIAILSGALGLLGGQAGNPARTAPVRRQRYMDALKKQGGWINLDTLSAALLATAVAIALTFASLGLQGCGTWQSNTRKALRVLSEVGHGAVRVAHSLCDATLQQCIKRRQNPCPALQFCHQAEKRAVQMALLAQMSALAGYAAVDAADQAKAEAALARARALLSALRATLKPFGVKLP